MQPGQSAQNGKVQLRGVIFDYGNVLCHPQQPSDMENMAEVCGIALSRFPELYWKSRPAYDRGDLDGESYWSTTARAGSVTLSRDQIARLIELDTASWARENDEIVRWALQLHHAGFRLALLSNMPLELSQSLVANGKWARFFEHRVFSCDVRRNKPDAAIYQTCLNALQLAPNEVLFLDDIAANVESAQRLGIHSLLFETLEKTWSALAKQFDLPAPSAAVQLQPR